MQWETSPRNRSLCFDVDLLFPAGKLQRFDVPVGKVLGDSACLALGKIKVGVGKSVASWVGARATRVASSSRSVILLMPVPDEKEQRNTAKDHRQR